MSADMSFFLSVWIKFLFLFTPFFAVSMFLSLTSKQSEKQRRTLALQVSTAVGLICILLFFFGTQVFTLFGITLDAFRVGAGSLLFLSAVALVQAKPGTNELDGDEDIAVVPLAMPVIVGPATIGTLMVLGAEITTSSQKTVGCVALLTAVVCVGILLSLASTIERIIGKRGINILSKITGLILAALAAEMIMSGIAHFLALNK